MNNPQVFALIDHILPFEACLYYQILPLSVEGSRIRLGVVDPKDTSALDYARQLLSYLNCSLVIENISSDFQRSILSAYLNYIGHQKSLHSSASRVDLAKDNPLQSDNLSWASVEENQQYSLNSKQQNYQSQPQTSSKLTNSLEQIPELYLHSSELSTSVEVMATLEPQKLLHELLVRVLESGIGRLYFEQQQSQGRILWSQDGVLQSVVENLEPTKIEGIINELKILTKMPLISLEKPRQVEIERIYQNNHLLLRLRVMPGNHGEEATLQVLRGAALRFYQQQQLSQLSQEALKLGKQLQTKINQVCSRQHLAPFQLESLLTLHKLLDKVEHQVESIISQQNHPNSYTKK